MRAITPVVSIVMLLVIAVAVIGGAYGFISGFFSTATSTHVQVVHSYCQDGTAHILIRNLASEALELSTTHSHTTPYSVNQDTVTLHHFDQEGSQSLDETASHSGTIYGNTQLLLHLDGNLNDESINAHTGNLNGGTYVSRGSGKALHFNASSQEQAVFGDILDLAGTDFTVEAWVKLETLPEIAATILDKYGNTGGYKLVVDNAGKVNFAVRNPDYSGTWSVGSNTTLTTGTWYHVAGVYKSNVQGGGAGRIFIDGIPDTQWTSLIAPYLKDTPNFLYLGYGTWSASDFYLDGTVDEVSIHTRELTDAEILSRYNSGVARFSEFQEGPPGFGNALYFDGVDDYVEIPYDQNLDPQTFTLEAWVKPQEITATSYIITRNLTQSEGYTLNLRSADKRARFTTYGTIPASLDSSSELVAGEWAHIAATFDGTEKKFYINGQEDSSFIISGMITFGVNSLNIGANPGSAHFKGLVDEVRLSSTAINFIQTQQGWSPSCETDCGDLLIQKTQGTPSPFYFSQSAIPPGATLDIRNACTGTCKYAIASPVASAQATVKC